MNRSFLQNLILRTLMFVGSTILLCPNLAAQNGFQPPEIPRIDEIESAIQEPAQQKSFKELVEDIRKNEAEINRLYSSMPIGFPELQAEARKKISDIRESNKLLKADLKAAAIRSYVNDPIGNPEAAQIVFSTITRKLDGSDELGFDPKGAVELCNAMLKAADVENPPVDMRSVAFQAFRASFALQDFERADMFLRQIEATGIVLESHVREKLSDMSSKWQRELMIRRLETNTDDLPRVKIITTEGDIVVELYENHAPQTVANFVSLVEKNFYTNMPFFMVKPGVLAETGCPVGDGSGDASYSIPCECKREQIRHHFTGVLSMSNDGKDTGSSKFFITYQPNGQFDGVNTAFGRVIEGMDIVMRLKLADPNIKTTGEPSKIIRTEVLRKRGHQYTPSRVAEKPSDQVGGILPSGNLQTVQGTPGG